MADLSELGLNRFLYRDNSNINSASALSSAFENTSTNQGDYGGGSNDSVSGSQTPAQDVVPGSIIQNSLIQSTVGMGRVEMNPNIDENMSIPAFPTVTQAVRAVLFDNGSGVAIVTAQLDKTGIYGINGKFGDLVVTDSSIFGGEATFQDNVNFDGINFYQTIAQPQIYYGIILSDATIAFLNTNTWTCTQISTGVYEITHNLNTQFYTTVCAPRNGHFRYNITQALNTVTISWQESSYSAGLYTGEVPVDVSFNINIMRDLTP